MSESPGPNDIALHSALGKIAGALEGLREQVSHVRDAQAESGKAVGRIESKIERLDERVSGHIRDDDRRFADAKEDTSRAHKKIEQLSRPRSVRSDVAREGDDDDDRRGAASKIGWVGGVLAGLGALGAMIAKWWEGGGS